MSTERAGSSVRVRRWLEDDATPVVLETEGRRTCGSASDHVRRGCIALAWSDRGVSGLFHLTTAEALRLSDLLRAMADANPATEASL